MYCNGFKDPQISKQGIAGKKKHGALMIPPKLEIIMRYEVAKIMEVMASYNVRSSYTI